MCCTVPAWVINAFYLIIFVLFFFTSATQFDTGCLSVVICKQINSNTYGRIVMNFSRNYDNRPSNGWLIFSNASDCERTLIDSVGKGFCPSSSTRGYLLFYMRVDLNEPKRTSREDFWGDKLKLVTVFNRLAR